MHVRPVRYPSTWDRTRRGGVAGGLVAALVASLLVVPAVTLVAATARPALAVEPPPGGLVDSVANFGRTAGRFAVRDDGAATYTLPLWTAAGRGEGVAPSLALSYHSNGGNGLVGVGWSLSGLSSIAWCSRTIAQDGYTDGGHVDGTDPLCLDGNRLVPTTAAGLPQRTYRTELESFARITAFGMEDHVPDHFRVEQRDGRILTFGQTRDARVAWFRVPRDASPQASVAWAVNKIEDRDGNAASVAYHQEHGGQDANWFVDMRPTRISYAPNRRIDFVYEERPDVLEGLDRGIYTRTAHRLKRIDVFGGPEGTTAEKLREHRLTYANHSVTGRSLLTQVVDCDGRGVCTLPLDLQWSVGGYAVQELDTDIGGFSGPHTVDELITGDIDGDGRDDLLYRHEEQGWQIRRSTGGGFGAPVAAGVPTLDTTNQKMRPIDFDRDGRLDLMAEVPDDSTGGTGWKLFRSNGSTLAPYSDNIGYFGRDDNQLDPIYFADLNGDGLPDFITATWDRDEPQDDLIDGPWRYRLNRGTETGGRFAPEVDTGSRLPALPDANRVVDSDGDGRAELIGEDNVRYPDKRWYALQLNTAGGVETPLANLHVGTGSLRYQQHFGDLNGDGLADQVLTSDAFRADEDTVINGQLTGALRSGMGVGRSSPGTTGFDTQPQTNGNFVVDFNNDGQDDVLSFRSHPFEDQAQQGAQLFVWRDGALSRAEMPTPLLVGSHNEWEDGDGRESDFSTYGWRLARPLDIDGNGVLDLVHIKLDKLHIKKRTDPMPDRLTGIGTYGTGQRVEIDYASLGDPTVHSRCTTAYPLVCLNSGGAVVREHRLATYKAAPRDWDRHQHAYEAARLDTRGRGWLGYAKHTVTRPLAATTTVTTYDNTTTDGGSGGVPLVYPYAHLPKNTTTVVTGLPAGTGFTGTRERERAVVTTHALRRFGDRYTVEPRQVFDTEQERLNPGGWHTLRATLTTTTFDGYGSADLTVTQTAGGHTLTEDPTFRNDETAWLIGLPTRTSTRDCTDAGLCVTRVTTSDYHPNGRLKDTVVEPDNPALKLTTSRVYGQFGTLTSETERDNAGTARVTAFEYNADHLYPIATVNAAGHRSVLDVHSGLGVPIATTGPNGGGAERVTMRYDRFGRLRETHRGDGSSELIEHASFFGLHITTTRSSGGGVDKVYTDAFDREIQREVVAFDGKTAITNTTHDALGRVSTVSRPRLLAEPRHDTTYGYDNLDRTTSVAAPDQGTVRHEYIGRETHTYDASNAHSYTLADVDGDVIASFEDDPDSTAWLATRFQYEPFGLTRTITAPDGTAQTMAYDTRGNRTTLVDPSAGTTTTTYTAFGEMRGETDGTGSTATYTYDALGRVALIQTADGRTTNTWDTAEHGIGKLASSDSPDNVFTRYRYNDLAQHVATSWKLSGETFEVVTHYDEFGRPASTTYPHVFVPGGYERLKVDYEYNAHGYLSHVRDAAAPAAAPPIWTAQARNAAGQLEREQLGNGARTTNEYSVVGLLSRTYTDGPGTVGRLADLTYGYDLDHNVTGRQDAVNDRAESFGYDPLNRLTSWRLRHGTADTTTAYTYDRVGNLKTETAPDLTRTYHHGENGAPPHALTGTGEDHDRFTYDGAGRQLTGLRRTVTYTRAGLPKTLTYGQNQYLREFDYDATGDRVRHTDPGRGVTQIAVGGLYERRVAVLGGDPPPDPGVEHIHNITVEGRVVAQVSVRQDSVGGPVTGGGTRYLHADAQGSTVGVSTGAGASQTEFFYDPWGQRVTDAGRPTSRNEAAPRRGYGGHDHDDNYNLIDMKGRMYDPENRRFLTTDPFITDPMASQALNRYSYVRNNPATHTDPTGLWCDGCIAYGSPLYNLIKDLNPGTLSLDDVFVFRVVPQGAGDQSQTKADGDVATDEGHSLPAGSGPSVCEDCDGAGDAPVCTPEENTCDLDSPMNDAAEPTGETIGHPVTEAAGTDADATTTGGERVDGPDGVAVAAAAAAGGPASKAGPFRRFLQKVVLTFMNARGGSFVMEDGSLQRRTRDQIIKKETQPPKGPRGGAGPKARAGVFGAIGTVFGVVQLLEGVLNDYDTSQRAQDSGRTFQEQLKVESQDTKYFMIPFFPLPIHNPYYRERA